MRQNLWSSSLLGTLILMGGCQTANHQTATSQPAPSPANPFVGYWYSGETYGKPIASTNQIHLDITADGRAILLASPQVANFGDPKPPDEIRMLHWERTSSGIRLTDPQSPEKTFEARVEGDSTLVIASPDFYLRFNRAG